MAEPILLRMESIHYSFGGRPLISNACLTVYKGDRIAITGRNGSGKSTLLKIAAGLLDPISGEVFRASNATIAYLEQMPDFKGYKTVKAYVESGHFLESDLYRIQYYLSSLGLTGDEAVSDLSGGEARRVALARILAQDPDILLLDEPTNHLDIQAIEWLEGLLKASTKAIIMISHDRRFLENVSQATVWLDRGQTRRMDKPFTFYEAWRDKILKEEIETQHKLEQQINREEHWLRYGVTARRKRNVRRLENLKSLRVQHKTHENVQGSIIIDTQVAKDSSKQIIKAHNICKAYADKVLVKNFSLCVHRSDRIGLVGRNGAGKTTLLKLLIKDIDADSGSVTIGAHLKRAYFDQKRALDLNQKVKDYLTDGRGDTVIINGEERHVYSYMKDFLFRQEQAQLPIEKLSGGERARLLLAHLFSKETNILIFDEPTNDLDMETLDVLEEMLANYKGTVLVVSHDRDFLDRIATFIIAPNERSSHRGEWIVYAGGYSDMLAQRSLERSLEKEARSDGLISAKAKKNKPLLAQGNVTEDKPKKLSFKQKYALENLPAEIKCLKETIQHLEKNLSDPELYQKDEKRFMELTEQLHEKQKEVTQKEEEWLQLEILREEIEETHG